MCFSVRFFSSARRLISGYRSLPFLSAIFKSHAIWLIPAISSVRPSRYSSIPSSSSSVLEHTCTLWHRPTVLTAVYRWI